MRDVADRCCRWVVLRLAMLAILLGLASPHTPASAQDDVAQDDVAQDDVKVEAERFYPPMVAIGKSSTVKVEGKITSWPVDLFCDRDEVIIRCDESSGSLTVEVPQDSAPGVAWIRLHHEAGASRLLPLLISPLSPVEQEEPNDSIDQAATVVMPTARIGRLEKRDDVDTFRVPVRAGQTLVASLVAHQVLRSPMDAVMQLLDAQGNVAAQADDVRGLDPQIVYRAEHDGEVFIRLFAFPETPNSTIGYSGAESFVYILRLTTDALVDHVAPLVTGVAPLGTGVAPLGTGVAPLGTGDDDSASAHGWNLEDAAAVRTKEATSISPSTAYLANAAGWQWQLPGPARAVSLSETGDRLPPSKASALPCIFSGVISSAGEVDRVRFDLTKGQRYRADVHARRFGLPLDSVLELVDTKSGKQLARNDDASRDVYDASLRYTAQADGEAELRISDLVGGHGMRHRYSVVIEEARPEVELTLASDRYSFSAGESLEIPVTLSRLDGFQDTLHLTIDPLPPGVNVDAATSEPTGGTSKAVKVKLTADADSTFRGPIRVVARVASSEENSNRAFVAGYSLRALVMLQDVWLTVTPKR